MKKRTVILLANPNFKEPDIKFLAGLAGGGSISGESGQRILGELKQIVDAINKNNPLRFQIQVGGSKNNPQNFFNKTRGAAKNAALSIAEVNALLKSTSLQQSKLGASLSKIRLQDLSFKDLTEVNKRLIEYSEIVGKLDRLKHAGHTRPERVLIEQNQLIKEGEAIEQTIADIVRKTTEQKAKLDSLLTLSGSVKGTLPKLYKQVFIGNVSQDDFDIFNQAYADLQTRVEDFKSEVLKGNFNNSIFTKLLKDAAALEAQIKEMMPSLGIGQKSKLSTLDSLSGSVKGSLPKLYKEITSGRISNVSFDSFSQQYAQLQLSIEDFKTEVSKGNFDQSIFNKLLKQASDLDAKIKALLPNSNVSEFVSKYTNSQMSTINSMLKNVDYGKIDANNVGDFTKASNSAQVYIDRINEIIATHPKIDDSLISALKSAETEFNAASAQLNKYQKEGAEVFASLSQVESLYKKIDGYVKQNPRIRNTSEYASLMSIKDRLKAQIAQKTQVSLTSKEYQEMNDKVAEYDRVLTEANKKGNTFVGLLKEGYKRFGGWSLITRSMMSVIRMFKNMITNIKTLDKAMTELKKVTSETSATYEKFLSNATVRAKNLGVTVADIVNATADFARLGYSISDAEALADAATVYKNVGDGIEDINQASESIISTMQAFGISAENAMNIVDKFNTVGNKFAISSTGVGTALQKSAASMEAAGNSIDETIALITAANTILQNPETVGTTMKTVSMYLRAAKTEAEEAGESTEGMANSVSELRNEILALTGNQVDLQIDDKNFKSTYQILKELSEVWGDLSDISQANILEMVAGKRNANAVAAILNNFEIAERVLEESANSAGSALEENEKKLDSIAGKTAKMQSTFETLSMSVLDSDTFKGFIDAATTGIEMVDKLINLLGLIPTVATAAGAALSLSGSQTILSPFRTETTFDRGDAYNKMSFDPLGFKIGLSNDMKALEDFNLGLGKMSVQLSGCATDGERMSIVNQVIAETMGDSSKTAKEYARSFKGLDAKIDGYKVKLRGMRAAQIAATAAQTALNMVFSMFASFAISGIISGISKLITREKDLANAAKESAEEIQNTFENSSSKINDNLSTLDKLKDEYSELSKGVDKFGDNISLSAEEYERYNEIVTQVVKISPTLIEGYDNEGKAIVRKNGLIERSIELMEEERRLELAKYTSSKSIGDLAEGAFENASDYIENTIEPMQEDFENSFSKMFSEAMTNSMKRLSENSPDDASKMGEKYYSQILNEFGLVNYEEYASTNINDFYSFASEYYDEIYKAFTTERDKFEKYFSEEEMIDMANFIAMHNFDSSQHTEQIKQFTNDVRSALKMLVDYSEKDLTDAQRVLVSSFVDIYDLTADTREGLGDKAKQARIEVLDLINTIDSNSDIGDKINNLFKINSNDFDTFAEYRDEVNKLISDVSRATGISFSDVAETFGLDNLVETYTEAARELNSIKFGDVFTEGTSEDIGKVQEKLSSLSDTFKKLHDGTLEVGDVIALLTEMPELAEYVDLTAEGFGNLDEGLRKAIKNTPKELVKTLKEFKETNKLTGEAGENIDNLCQSLEDLSTDSISDITEEFGLVEKSIRKANDALTELDKILSEPDYDANYEKRVEHFAEFKAAHKAGEYGSKAYDAYKKAFGVEDLTDSEIGEWIKAQSGFYTEDSSKGLQKFLDTIVSKHKELEGIASFENGVLRYDVKRMEEFADIMDMNVETLQDFFGKYRIYSPDYATRGSYDTFKELSDKDVFFDMEGSLVSSMVRLRDETGKADDEILNLISDINEMRKAEGSSEIKVFDDSLLKDFEGFKDIENKTSEETTGLIEALRAVGIEMKGAASFDKKNLLAIFNTEITETLKKLGWAEDEINSLRDRLIKPFHIKFAHADTDTLEDVKNSLEEYVGEDTIVAGTDKPLQITQKLIDDLITAKVSIKEIEGLLVRLASRDDVGFDKGLIADGVLLDDLIGAQRDEKEIVYNVKLNNEEVLMSVQEMIDMVNSALKMEGEEPVLNIDSDVAIEDLAAVYEKLIEISNNEEFELNAETDDAIRNLDKFIRKVNDVLDLYGEEPIVDTGMSPYYRAENHGISAYAKGTKHAKGGLALLGDEYSPIGAPKPELVLKDGEAFLAGTDGPTMFDLNPGDIVYSHTDTKKILKGGGVKSFPRFNEGNDGGNGLTAGGSISLYNSNGKPKVAVSPVLDDKALEEQLADTLDKFEEEASDVIGDFEHDIFLAEKHNASAEEIISTYREMQKTVNEYAEKYRKLGLSDNSDYIQELQKQWWDYEESINQLRQDAFDKYLDDSKFQIEVLKADGASVQDVTESWKSIFRAIDDEVAYYTSRGYDYTSEVMQNLIQEGWDVKEEIKSYLEEVVSEANDVLDGFKDTYDTITDAAKEYAQNGFLSADSLQSVLELGPKYLDFLQDENGQLVLNEENLQAVIAAKTEEMAATNALAYAKQILFAAEQKDISTLDELIKVTAAGSGATWDMAYATLGLARAIGTANGISSDYFDEAHSYIVKMQSLAKTASSSVSAFYKTINESYVSQADGLNEILELTQDLIKWENERDIEALEKQNEMYQEIIESKKTSLELTLEEEQRDRDRAEKLSEIAKLQSRIEQLSLDDSREAQAQKKSLQEELRELQKELADDQAEYSLDVQTEALDKEAEAFEENINNEIEILKEMLNSTQKLYDAAISRIESDWDGLYTDLINWNKNYGSSLQSEITAAWDAACDAVERYGSFTDALEGVKGHTQLGGITDSSGASQIVSAMKQNSLNWWTAPDSERSSISSTQSGLKSQYEAITGEKLVSRNGSWYKSNGEALYTLSEDEIISAVVSVMKQNSAAWLRTTDQSTRNSLDRENNMLASRLQSLVGSAIKRNANGEWMINGKKLYDVYHTGGIVGGKSTLEQDEVMAILEKGEMVLDEKKENALYKVVDFIDYLSDKLGKTLDRTALNNAFGTGLKRSSYLTEPITHPQVNNDISFSPSVYVTINNNGNLTESDARRFGDIAAESTLSKLSSAFTRRGISALGNATLK